MMPQWQLHDKALLPLPIQQHLLRNATHGCTVFEEPAPAVGNSTAVELWRLWSPQSLRSRCMMTIPATVLGVAWPSVLWLASCFIVQIRCSCANLLGGVERVPAPSTQE